MSVRSKEQLSTMLKLIEVNHVSLTRKNVTVRQKVWECIANKLNSMHGAVKDVDGWKRSYYTWRLHLGSDFNKEVQKLIENTPDDDFFHINISDDELESENADKEKAAIVDPKEKQKLRLHELVTKHRDILNSTADDEPLKKQIWLNISEELNKISGGMQLKPKEWLKCVDWEKYRVRRGRKAYKRPALETLETEPDAKRINGIKLPNVTDIKCNEITDSESIGSQDIQGYEQDYTCAEEIIEEEPNLQTVKNSNLICKRNRFSRRPQKEPRERGIEQNVMSDDNGNDDVDDNDLNSDIEMLLNDCNGDADIDYYDQLEDDDVDNNDDTVNTNTDIDDISELEYKRRTIKPTPIVKSFKFTNRIANSVDKLSSDVCDIKVLLKKTTNMLECIENVLQQHTRKQDKTNALLKRNGQLMKVLVEYKCGKRQKRVNKK